MEKGVFCISIDLEFLWGRSDLNYQPFIWRVKKERKMVQDLLNLLHQYRIPATWAIVGKLFLNPPKGTKNADLWYAKDIINLIKGCSNQEIACHSFTHAIFNKLNSKQAEKEIQDCIEVAKKNKIQLSSFVFPRNKVKHLKILKRYGFKSFRGPDKHPHELILPTVPPVYLPTPKSGLIEITGSMYLVSSRGLKKYIPSKLRVLKAKLGINAAVTNKRIFHIWFHPTDLVDNPNGLLNALSQIIRYAKQKENEKLLNIFSMREIAEGC